MDVSVTCFWTCVQIESGQGNNQNTTQKQYNARYPQPYDESDSDSNSEWVNLNSTQLFSAYCKSVHHKR